MKNRAYNKQLRISRERFASTVKRDKLNNASQADLDLIQDGDGYFHGGNCVLDMDIWEPTGNRKDLDTFQYLYELTPTQVEFSCPQKPLTHLMTTPHRCLQVPCSDREIVKSDFPCCFLSEPNHRLTKLYWEFREAINRVPRISNLDAGV